MFKHAFKVKSNTNIKNSDRRKLLSNIGESASELFGKAPFSVAIAQMVSEKSIAIYICEKQPLFFEVTQGELYPTVYLTWLVPSVFPTLFINEGTFAHLQNGADLMLPGVMVDEKFGLPEFGSGAVVCVSIFSFKKNSIQGPVAIGKALMSSQEMIQCGMKGKGVQILHVYQDKLWTFGRRETVPVFEVSKYFGASKEESSQAESEAVEGVTEAVNNVNIGSTIQEDVEELPPEDSSENQAESESVEANPEEFLRKVFLYALRCHLPKDQKFPMDVGQFYATIILKALPEGQKIDMKKTKYKKFSTFLNQVNETAGEGNWFVKVVSKKNIDSIVEFNLKHPEIVNAEPLGEQNPEEGKPKLGKIKIAECFTLTESSLKELKNLHPNIQLKKGEILHPNQISDIVKAYIDAKGLSKPGNKAELDDSLQTIMKLFTPEIVPVNDIVQKFTSRMTKAFLITAPDGRRFLRKTRIPQIVLKVEVRTGKKTVSLVNNLSAFGIDPKEFSQKVQNAISTGATVIPEVQCCIGPQVLVNGNQINYICELLIEGYGLQKKYISGTELGTKSKKGKK